MKDKKLRYKVIGKLAILEKDSVQYTIRVNDTSFTIEISISDEEFSKEFDTYIGTMQGSCLSISTAIARAEALIAALHPSLLWFTTLDDICPVKKKKVSKPKGSFKDFHFRKVPVSGPSAPNEVAHSAADTIYYTVSCSSRIGFVSMEACYMEDESSEVYAESLFALQACGSDTKRLKELCNKARASVHGMLVQWSKE